MKTKANIILSFYKSYGALSIIASLFCAYLYFNHGLKVIGALFWMRLLLYMVIIMYIRHYRQREFYYYRNLGLSERKLWGISLTADFLLFILFMLLTSSINAYIRS